ncbi:MAG TPA: enoyl-CoA hydratase/isomerase family protein [Caulobacteraceae bacterium]|jgi:enoyl-CoA hydratase/carnithine racemase|nr:enoyl-CoA hydratase/isomerase family protein [Caulobacteraceae bacterium]
MTFAGGSFETIIVDTPRPAVARITLNREKQMNAYSWRMTQELQAAIGVYRDDDEMRALVITGAGGRAFCTGGDISGVDAEHGMQVRNQPMGHGREMRDGMQAVLAMLRQIDKPSVAMIDGFAVAGGLALALACDFRFAGPTARLGDTSGRFGLLPDEGGAWLFPHVMGYDRALKMTLLHEIYDAPTALSLGLLTELVDEDLEERTLAFCEALAAQAPLATRTVKMMMRRATQSTFEASLEDAQLAVMITNPSADVREGGAAFREKRAPKFTGR